MSGEMIDDTKSTAQNRLAGLVLGFYKKFSTKVQMVSKQVNTAIQEVG